MGEVVTVLTNPRRKHHRRKSRRNPAYLAKSYYNPDYGSGQWTGVVPQENIYSTAKGYQYQNPGFPDFGDVLVNGSPLTQDVAVADIAVAGLSFGVNDWLVKALKLHGNIGLLGAAIMPFVTGSLVGMFHERWGTVTFLGGQASTFLKVVGKIPQFPFALRESGNHWLLETPNALLPGGLAIGGSTAKAGALEEIQPYYGERKTHNMMIS